MPQKYSMNPTHAGNFRIPFGRHAGKSVRQVWEEDRQYIEWLVQQPWFKRGTPLSKAVRSFRAKQRNIEGWLESPAWS